MQRILLLAITAIMLLICDTSPGWAVEPLKQKWIKEGLSFERICKPGKLIIAGVSPQCLIDLTNGEVLYQTKPDSNELGIYINYFGDKFYVFVYGNGKNELREYETKTKKYLRTINNSYLPRSPIDESGGYSSNTKSLRIFKAFTRELVDSIYFPVPFEIGNEDGEFTIDNKYFLLTFNQSIHEDSYFYLYDRTKREFLFKEKKGFTYCLFNKSNKMAYAESMKLAGDDTIYSYIRIYDPDQRKVVQDIKISKFDFIDFIIRDDDNYIIYKLKDGYNTQGIYDFSKNKIINYDLKLLGSPVRYFDSSLIVTAGTGYFAANIFDWTTAIKDINPKDNAIIYPNPADNSITVTIAEQYYSGIWNITDLTEKSVMKGIILPQNKLQINIGALKSQTYYLTLKKDNLLKTYQLVKK